MQPGWKVVSEAGDIVAYRDLRTRDDPVSS